MGGIYITSEIIDSVYYYFPSSSKAYFTSLQGIFIDILREDVLPTLMILAKFGVLQRVFHWSKIQLEFFKLHQYLGYLRKTVYRKKRKAENRVKVHDGADVCRSCQENFGNDDLYILVSHLVMDQAHEQFMTAMTFPCGLENSVITSLAMAVQRINAYQLLEDKNSRNQLNYNMGGMTITYAEMDTVYYVPLSSQEYFAPFREILRDILREDLLPALMILAKFGVLHRVIRWSKILMDFYRLRQYLSYLRETIEKKTLKSKTRVLINDGTDACRACQSLFGNDGVYIFYQVSYAVLDQAQEHLFNGMMLPGGLEQSAITSFAMAAQRVNAYQLQISNYEVADVERKVLTSLENAVRQLQMYTTAHLIIAFLTNTIYITCLLKL